MFKFKIIKLSFFLIFFFSVSNVFSIEIENIVINGNKRISKETIYNYVLQNDNYRSNNSNALDSLQKKLFATGFFSEIKIKYIKNSLIIDVKENPFIKFFYVDGISESEFDNLQKFLLNKENSFFSEAQLKIDNNKIVDFFKSKGFYNIDFSVDLIKLENNQINLIYNIKKNNVSKIKKIEFIGNKKFTRSTLYSVINSSIDGWWKFLSSTTKVNNELLNYDVELLKRHYLNNGFYDFQVLSFYYEKLSGNSVSLIFSLYEGNKYDFESIEIINKNIAISKDILNKIKLIANENLNTNYSLVKIQKFRNEIDDLLEYNNLSDLKYSVAEIKKNNKININLIFSKITNIYQIKNISIVGNEITNESVIRRNLFFQEGDNFNEQKLKKSIRKLRNLGIFKEVKYEIKFNNSESDNSIDIKFEIVEQATGEISAGAGAGTNGAVINFGIQEKNFLGNGNRLSSYINLGTEKIEGNINFTDNDFQKSGNSLTTSLYATKYDFTDSSGYENSIYGSKISLRYELFENIFFSPGMALEYDSFDANINASTLIKKRDGDYLSSKVFYKIFNDKKNSSINPTEGYDFGFGQTLSALISDVPSIENIIFGSYYREIKPKFNGSIKYRLRSINGIDDDVKFSERFHLSEQVLRGFKSRGVGPKDGNDHVGGNYSINSSFGTTVPSFIPENWNTTTGFFVDMANVWGIDYSDSIDDSNGLRMSIGVGLNWLSPLGPISMTYASPLLKESSDNERQFSFNLGTVF